MSSQSIWFAYDPNLASSIRTRLADTETSDLWILDNATSTPSPHIILDKYLGNPIQQITTKKSSEHENSYDPMRGDHQTIESLNSFLRRQCWRSAVDWTITYLIKYPQDYHIWFIRFACLIKLRLFQTIENEFETFGNLNSYTKLPFCLRLLHAELPIYMDSNHFHDENLSKEFLSTKELFSLFRNEFSSNKLITPLQNPMELNNHSVMLLYMSKMKESLDLYEKLIRDNNENIHEAIIYNMCTIYELESSRFAQKKHDLIDYISKYIGDGFSLTALKL
ncbi:unnamed protein product [Rotaria socialis]|uniref:Uncharacterized protein n=1 Tax=Rotaria socialis TaxID=392032 RepID=A0A820J7E2_9BILA|nr:unnamed protein product [Rotaria socialis]